MIPIHPHKSCAHRAPWWRPSFETLERRLVPGEALFGGLLGTYLLVPERGLAEARPADVRLGMWSAAASHSVLESDSGSGAQAIILVPTSSPIPAPRIADRQNSGTSGAASQALTLDDMPSPEFDGTTASHPLGVGAAGVELRGSSTNGVPAGAGASTAPRTASPGAATPGVGPMAPASASLPLGYVGAMLRNSLSSGGGPAQPGPVAGAATVSADASMQGHGDPPPPGGFAFSVSLAPDRSLPQLVGEAVIWTATAANGGDTTVYQFSVGPSGGPMQVVRDFSPANSFVWAPMQEGSFDVRVIAKQDLSSSLTMAAVVTDPVLARVTGGEAVITPTANPLVALYSAPPSAAATMYVNFRPAAAPDSTPWLSTAVQTCTPGKSTNFLVAGMLPDTTYVMESVAADGEISPPQLFTTGSLPEGLVFPKYTVLQSPAPGTVTDQNMVLHMSLYSGDPSDVTVLATDLTGQVTWYYDTQASGFNVAFGTTLEPGGRMFLLLGNASLGFTTVREIDLAGNVLGETNMDAVNAQLTARGLPTLAGGFHHDVERLPDGKIALLGAYQKDVDLNGRPLLYDVDVVLVLDQNWQLTWFWDSAAHLDLQRLSPLPEDIINSSEVDWTHANKVSWSPTDGDLLVSLRSQDWVVKIDYAYGTGDGHIVWRLGQDGDFTINSDDPYPWFSHQHDAYYLDDSTLILFDNGNTRCELAGDCNSRGQVLSLDEQTMTVTPVLNAYVGSYSWALGSGQQLADGSLVFTSGIVTDADGYHGQTIEMLPDGTITYILQQDQALYRSFVLTGLYGTDPTTSPPAAAGSPPRLTAAPTSLAGRTSGGANGGGPIKSGGPQIIAQTPSADAFGSVGTVEVTFDEPIDPTTFTPAQVRKFKGPLGPIPVLDVTPVPGSDNTQFDIDFAPQAQLGHYTLTIGPDIQDLDGVRMASRYVGRFTLEGPAVIASTPAASADFTGSVATVHVTFNEPIDATTFTPDKVDYFNGPPGRIPVAGVTPVPGSDNTQFDITFVPQGYAGSYTLALGPDILDQFGTLMDQNGDFIAGQFPDDLFTLTFSIQSPRLVSQAVNGALGVYSFRLTFSEPIDPQTFTVAQVSSFTGPNGTIAVVVAPVAGSKFTQFDVVFAPQFHAGDYALVLSPGISDGFGNALGESYALSFTLAGPRIASSTPNGNQTGPVDHVRVTWNYPINAASFTLDQVAQFLGPSGDIPVTGVTVVPGTNQTAFDIRFDPQSDLGDYQIVFGTGILDVYGNTVDASYTPRFRLVASAGGPGAAGGRMGQVLVAMAGTGAIPGAPLSPASDPLGSRSRSNEPTSDGRAAWLAMLDREFVEAATNSVPRAWTGATRHPLVAPAYASPPAITTGYLLPALPEPARAAG